MTDLEHWSPDRDPPRDALLARQLRTAGAAVPGDDVDWERVRASVMSAAAAGIAGRVGPGEWWDVVVQWRRVAAAASVAAILAAGGLVWRSGWASDEITIGADAAPESVALARVVAEYPDDAVLVSFLETARDDELAAWGTR